MSSTLSDAALLALVAVVPLVALMLTSFVKVSVVLSLLRNAIGATDAPSGLVVMGLSLVLTFFVMAPVGVEMIKAGASAQNAPASPPTTAPGVSDELVAAIKQLVPADRQAEVDAVHRSLGPLKGFLSKHASERDKATFVELGSKLGTVRSADEMAVLAPAFIATELREAFAIAVLIFIPFLVIDLLVGLGISALGLMSTSPQVVSLPLKLLLFVAVDGWRLLLESVLRGYA